MTKSRFVKSNLAILSATVVAVSGLFAFGAPAFANTALNPTITFNGNTLASSNAPADETAARLAADSNALNPAALSRVLSTTRSGYAFGGWSFTLGGVATTELTTTTTSDTVRPLFAVWNTAVRYDTNGADSGNLTNFKTQDVYRFGQDLALPNAGTMVKAGYAFGGWMSSAYSPTRITNYRAGSSDVGNPTLYAAWIKNVSFDANGSSGTVPASLTFTNGGPRLNLPSFTETTLRRPGFNFAGWATFPTGSIVSNPRSFVPSAAQNTLYAIWKVQGTSATSEISFKPGRSILSARQRLALDTLASSIGRGSEVKVTVAAVRAQGTTKALGKARNRAVVRYLKTAGINATITRSNSVGTSGTALTPRNNRVAVQASWTNPAN